MRVYRIIATAVAVGVIAVPSASVAADTKTSTKSTTTPVTQTKKKPVKKDPRLHKQAGLIAEAQLAVWRCQDQRQLPRTRASVSPWELPQSHAYRKWVHKTWVKRQRECLVELHRWDDVVRQLQRGLSGTPMDGSAGDLLAAGLKYRISPFFIAAIAGTESSFGAAACRNNRFNAFGLSSCGSGWSVPNFQSWRESYFFMGAFLTGHTRVTNGWPNAQTTMDYHGYAACSACWGRKTAMHMRQRFGVGNSVRF